MAWDKFVKPAFITLWSRLPAHEKQAITQAMEDLARNPGAYRPSPVQLMNGDLLIAVLQYWIQYRLDETQRRVIFIRLRTD
jgi:plasmid stabilization system protein ParE